MKAFNGFKSEASTGKIKQLPVGAYVAKIKKDAPATVETVKDELPW